MKNYTIKTFKLYENAQGLTKEQQQFLDEHVFGTWYYDEESGEVEVDGKLDLRGSGLKGIKFSAVHLSMFANGCGLTSLDGFPKAVGRALNIGNNRLKTLKGGPQDVEGDYMCFRNELESLEGSPEYIIHGFDCSHNRLETLKGGPKQVEDDFNFSDNQVSDLIGAPDYVGGSFVAANNNLTSLEGLPHGIPGGYDFTGNPVDHLTLTLIADSMLNGSMSYEKAVESNWDDIPEEDKELLYRPSFEFLNDEEHQTYALKQRVSGKIF